MTALASPLIDALTLQERMASHAPPLLLDLRFDLTQPEAGRRAYEAGHIPGAHYLSLDDCCGPKHGADGAFRGRHPLPTREAFTARLIAMGWTLGRGVVVYDASGGMFAARAWWMLQWLGDDQVQVLDGGFPAWQAAGLPVTSELVVPLPAATLSKLPPSLVETLEAEDLMRQMGRVRLVDARAAERFRGDVEPLDAQAGHIPGAQNRPFAMNLTSDGRFKSAQDLQAEWTAVLAGHAQAVHQCGSGVTACHNMLALAVAGLPMGTLYPGSWSEWSSDPARPVART
jgi:thiosulfate/3-mercaptopyruvate sulfurtransferase